MTTRHTRRRFVQSSLSGAALLGLSEGGVLGGLSPVSADEAKLDAKRVEFRPEIEPLVRLIEETPRGKLLEEMAARVRQGASYQEVLAALFLAGIRNVQPRPAVGFKFHAVLVVNSAHIASVASPDADRWLPIFWALDQFKSSQAQDEREGNWTMPAVNESAVPTASAARKMFLEAMEQWDEPKADAAVARLARTAGAGEMFEIFARLGCRDFRSIGHKAIYVANSWRTLQCIGWQHSEPVLRSLAYALLNHQDEPNPAKSDLAADRPYRRNVELAKTIRADWADGTIKPEATQELLGTLRTASAEDICRQVVEMINRGVSTQSVWDALFLGAGELLMRQPAIVALHAVTTTNAMAFAFQHVRDDETRRLLLLQNAAFLTLFREAMGRRGEVKQVNIAELSPAEKADGNPKSIESIFASVGRDSMSAASQVFGYLQKGGNPEEIMDAARVLIFLKGNDSHDYKFSSAALEDFYHVSPAWRDRFLASSVFKLLGSGERDNPVVARIRSALA